MHKNDKMMLIGILEQQAFGMIFVNIGQQLGTPELQGGADKPKTGDYPKLCVNLRCGVE